MIVIVLTLIAWGGESSREPTESLVTAKKAAAMILAQQTSDGAITMGRRNERRSSVVSYFGCFAAQGLVAVYRRTQDPELLMGAKKWVDWYIAHQNADGTIFDFNGNSDDWTSSGQFDSTDSYAAVYIDLLRDVHQAAPDVVWLADRKPSIVTALKGIRLTMQPCGLTTAKPDYPVMYTMDNVETLLGLRAAVVLAEALGDSALQQQALAEANRMEAAISSELWNPQAACYRVGVQLDGGKMESLRDWYPDIMANLMAVAWLPRSERNEHLYARLIVEFGGDASTNVNTRRNVERLVWWGWAATGAADKSLASSICSRLGNFDSVYQSGCNPGLLGHIARLCAMDRITSGVLEPIP
jgi:hypothetical protein